MPFVHWLQDVLLPPPRDVSRGASSRLAAQAVREFDGDDRVAPLIDVLHEIDSLCATPPGQAAIGPARGIGGLLPLADLVTAIGIAPGLWVAQWAEQGTVVALPAARQPLDDIAKRLVPGVPEPQMVEIEGRLRQWLSIAIAIVGGRMSARRRNA